MKQSTTFVSVANKFSKVLQGYTRGIRVVAVLTMLLIMGIGQAWGADKTVKWTASSGALGSEIGSGTIKTGTFSWNYTRTLISGETYTGWQSNCVQVGKNGGVENITFRTSSIPGTIKSVSVECSSYQGKHKVAITVGGNSYLASTATSSWTTVEARTGKGTKSGEIVISFTGGSRALYIKSISVTYEETPTWKIKGSWDGWTEHAMTVNGTEATCQIDLAQGQGYEFGFDGNSSFYKNSGAIITDISGWVFSTNANNAHLYTGPAGTYTFKINTSTKQVQVIYPTVTHPAEGYAYFQKQDSWNGLKVYNFTSDNDRLSDWDGSPSVTNTTTICGKTYYYTALATQFQKVIFRDNGSNQWKEINVSGYSGKYCGDDYNASTQTWNAFNKYSITFNSNGGSGTMSTISGICPGNNQILPANTFSRTGYTFDGWATSANGNKVYNDKATISNINSNITLYARWKANTYTITSTLTNCSSTPAIPTSYTYTGSAANLSYTIAAASGYRLPDAVTVSGTTYTWDKNTGQLKLTGTINSNVTITIKAIKVHTITWMVNGQQYGEKQEVDDNQVIGTLPTASAPTSCSDKVFMGWTESATVNNDGSSITYISTSTKPDSDKTYHAVFATKDDGGSGDYELVTSAPDDWSGTYLIIDGKSKNCFNGSLTTLDANGNYKSVAISNNKITSNSTTDSYSVTISKSTTDGKYYIQTYSGYYIGSNAIDSSEDNELDALTTEKYDNSISISSNNVTIKGPDHILKFFHQTNAEWRFRFYKSTTTQNVRLPQLYKKTAGTTYSDYVTSCIPTYTITWKNDDGTELETDNVEHGVVPTYDGDTPTKEATAQYTYTFNGWTPEIVAATADATYTATYTATTNTYTIRWKDWDGTVLEIDNNVPYGTTPTYNDATPNRPEDNTYKYTFAGWDPEVKNVDGDQVYTAKYTQEKHQITVTWMVNGEEYTLGDPSTTVSAGEQVAKLPTEPTPDEENNIYCGQVFAGWTDKPIEGEPITDAPALLFKTSGSSPTLYKEGDKTTIIFYAVFADYKE